MNKYFYKKILDNINVALLSKIALILTAISCITWFVSYSVIDYEATELAYEFSFHFPGLSGIFSLLTNITPYILLTLFFHKNSDKIRVPILLCVVFGLLSINSLFTALIYFGYSPVLAIVYILLLVLFAFIAFSSMYFKKYHNKFDITVIIPTVFVILAYSYIMTSTSYLGYLYYAGIRFREIPNLLLSVLFVLSTISALKGLSKKIFAIIALSVGLLLKVINLVSFVLGIGIYVESGRYLYLLTNPAGIVAEGALYLILLIFVLNNEIPSVMSYIDDIVNSVKSHIGNISNKEKKITPEQELRALNDKLELGMITEEEYQSQRSEIISKL